VKKSLQNIFAGGFEKVYITRTGVAEPKMLGNAALQVNQLGSPSNQAGDKKTGETGERQASVLFNHSVIC
jgi:hypothetical protein